MQQSRNQATAMIAVLSEAVVSIQARSNGTLIYILRAILKSSSTPSLTPHRFFFPFFVLSTYVVATRTEEKSG